MAVAVYGQRCPDCSFALAHPDLADEEPHGDAVVALVAPHERVAAVALGFEAEVTGDAVKRPVPQHARAVAVPPHLSHLAAHMDAAG